MIAASISQERGFSLLPFLDLKVQDHSIKNEIDAAGLAVVKSTQYVLGQYVADFEKEFAKYSCAAEGIAVNSGASTLHLVPLAAGIGKGEEKLVTVPASKPSDKGEN